jgi:hypothetical protein
MSGRKRQLFERPEPVPLKGVVLGNKYRRRERQAQTLRRT